MLLFPSLPFVYFLLCKSSYPALFKYIPGATYLHPSPVNLTEPFVSHGEKGNLCHSRYTAPINLPLGNAQAKELLGRRAALCVVVEM